MESETIEYKKSLADLSSGLHSIAAILIKHAAGELWFGVKNDGQAVGMEVSDTTLRKVSQAIAAHIEPRIYPEVSTVDLQGKSCIRIAFSGNEKPYFAHGRAYMRVADEDRQLSAKQLEALIIRKNRNHLGWDAEPITDTAFTPDVAKLRAFVNRAGLPWVNATDALKNLGLLADGSYLNAARVFFSKSPPLTLRCGVFGTLTTSTIIDQHDFQGDILSLIEEAEKYILKNIRIGMRLEGLVRVDVPEIDREAFREAIINAFCHRDYRDPDEVRIAIFPDRVEVRNPGTLLEGLTLRKLRTSTVSRRRNPLIADLLRRIHLIEAWGRGIPLILDKAPDARFTQVAGTFVASFPRVPASEVSAPESRIEPQSPTVPVTDPVADPVQRLLLALADGAMAPSALWERLGLKHRPTFRENYLHPALSQGLIERTIPDKPNSRLQQYRLTPKGRARLS